MAFGRRKKQSSYIPPSGLVTCPQAKTRSVKFVFNEDNEPAGLAKVDLLKKQPQTHVNLIKGFEAAAAAFQKVELSGLQAEVIVLLDTSWSMEPEYTSGQEPIVKLLIRVLGWALNVDADGSIPVIRYGGGVAKPVYITTENYLDAKQLLPPIYGSTPMTEALQAALAMASKNTKMTVIINLTDGGPDNQVSMDNAVIESSTGPYMILNVALKHVKYLKDLDDMPSLWEIRKDDDDNPILDPDGSLIIDKNTNTDEDTRPRRFIDNVDTQAVDPYNDSDEVLAAKLTTEIGTLLEVWGRTGILEGVPGVDHTIF